MPFRKKERALPRIPRQPMVLSLKTDDHPVVLESMHGRDQKTDTPLKGGLKDYRRGTTFNGKNICSPDLNEHAGLAQVERTIKETVKDEALADALCSEYAGQRLRAILLEIVGQQFFLYDATRFTCRGPESLNAATKKMRQNDIDGGLAALAAQTLAPAVLAQRQGEMRRAIEQKYASLPPSSKTHDLVAKPHFLVPQSSDADWQCIDEHTYAGISNIVFYMSMQEQLIDGHMQAVFTVLKKGDTLPSTLSLDEHIAWMAAFKSGSPLPFELAPLLTATLHTQFHHAPDKAYVEMSVLSLDVEVPQPDIVGYRECFGAQVVFNAEGRRQDVLEHPAAQMPPADQATAKKHHVTGRLPFKVTGVYAPIEAPLCQIDATLPPVTFTAHLGTLKDRQSARAKQDTSSFAAMLPPPRYRIFDMNPVDLDRIRDVTARLRAQDSHIQPRLQNVEKELEKKRKEATALQANSAHFLRTRPDTRTFKRGNILVVAPGAEAPPTKLTPDTLHYLYNYLFLPGQGRALPALTATPNEPLDQDIIYRLGRNFYGAFAKWASNFAWHHGHHTVRQVEHFTLYGSHKLPDDVETDLFLYEIYKPAGVASSARFVCEPIGTTYQSGWGGEWFRPKEIDTTRWLDALRTIKTFNAASRGKQRFLVPVLVHDAEKPDALVGILYIQLILEGGKLCPAAAASSADEAADNGAVYMHTLHLSHKWAFKSVRDEIKNAVGRIFDVQPDSVVTIKEEAQKGAHFDMRSVLEGFLQFVFRRYYGNGIKSVLQKLRALTEKDIFDDVNQIEAVPRRAMIVRAPETPVREHCYHLGESPLLLTLVLERAIEMLEAERAGLTAIRASTRADIEALVELERKYSPRDAEALAAELAVLQQRYMGLQAQLAQEVTLRVDAERSVASLTMEGQRLSTELSTVRQRHETDVAQLTRTNATLTEQKEANARQAALQLLQLTNARKEIINLKTQLQTAQTAEQEAKRTLADTTRRIEAERASGAQQKRQLERQVQGLQREKERLTTEVRQLETNLERAEAQLAAYEARQGRYNTTAANVIAALSEAFETARPAIPGTPRPPRPAVQFAAAAPGASRIAPVAQPAATPLAKVQKPPQ